MATLTYTDLVASYPEFTTTDADTLTRINTFLQVAEDTIGTAAFASSAIRDRCRLAVAAHVTSSANADNCSSGSANRAGPVTSRTRGSRSVTYASPKAASSSAGDFDLTSTRYGQIALMLLSGRRHIRGIVS